VRLQVVLVVEQAPSAGVTPICWLLLTTLALHTLEDALRCARWYSYRWLIETAFLLVKRLLDLAYLWVGSLNSVQLQVWATFLSYAILIDLCDELAEQLHLPLDRISVEMVYRSLYF